MRVPDRRKARRDDLRKKGWAYTRMTFFQVLAVITGLGMLGFLSWLGRAFWMGDGYRYTQEIPEVAKLCFGGFAAVCAYVLLRCQFDVIRIKHEEADIQPVTSDTRPADEILVLGAEEPPVVQSELLLRAATGQETAQEELLRITENG